MRTRNERVRIVSSIVVVGAAFVSMWWWIGDVLTPPPVATPPSPHGPEPAAALSDASSGARGTTASPTTTVLTRTTAPTTLPPLATGLTGRLVQNGEGLAQAKLLVHPSRSSELVAETRSDAAGHFAVEVPAGLYDLRLAGTSPRGMVFPGARVADGEQRALGDLIVPSPASVVGSVVDEAGLPLADVEVHGWWGERWRDQKAGETAHTRTDARGRFTVANLRPGEVAVHAEHPDRHGYPQRAHVAPGGTADVGELVLRTLAPLRGFVIDAAGQPVAGAVVTPGGGRHEALQRDRSVRTGSDGSFVLRGFGSRDSLSVEKEGLAPTVLAGLPEQPRPVRVQMARSQALVGTVIGNDGLTGVLRVSSLPGDHRNWPWFVGEVLYRAHPVAADGTFSIAHLPAGAWHLSIDVPGRGTVLPTRVDVPLTAPLELPLVPDRRIEVAVVDDAGAPVPAAMVRLREPGHVAAADQKDLRLRRDEFTTDAEGLASIEVPAGVDIKIAATAPRHIEGSGTLAADAASDRLVIQLRRGGVIHGRVVDAALRRHLDLSVEVRASDAQKTFVAGMAVDASGSFRSTTLPAGRYRIGLLVGDATHFVDNDIPVPEPVPVVHDFSSRVPEVDVDVLPGAEVALELQAPELGRIDCRATVAGHPASEALVYARIANKRERLSYDPDDQGAFEYEPHVRTDAQGRCHFFVAVEATIELRVRLPSSGAWTGPFVVDAMPAGATRTIELPMHAAAIRGSYDVSAIAPVDREFCEAQLYAIGDAAEDPFAFPHHTLPASSRAKCIPIGATGRFAFEGLPPGTWVLRLVERRRMTCQRVLVTVADEVHDLGRVEPPPRVTPRLACGLPPGHHTIDWRIDVAGSAGVFVATSYRDAQGQWNWPAVAPGAYSLEVERHTPWGATPADAKAKKVAITVHDDGSTSPATVWPDGH